MAPATTNLATTVVAAERAIAVEATIVLTVVVAVVLGQFRATAQTAVVAIHLAAINPELACFIASILIR